MKPNIVISRARADYTPTEIAHRTGQPAAAIRQQLYRLRRRGGINPVQKFSQVPASLPEHELRALEIVATKYNTTASRMIHKILSIIIRDDLFAAVIDDEEIT